MKSGKSLLSGFGRRARLLRHSGAAIGAGLVGLNADCFPQSQSLSSTSTATVTTGTVLNISAAPPTKQPVLPVLSNKYDYDVIVIGGGSGGLACAREIASLEGKTALFDFVAPSAHGTKWGIGGTCVNVGCIPKKLMHNAALLGQSLHDAKEYGWQVEASAVKHDWTSLAANVQDYIRGTNWGYRNALRDERVEYINALARVVDGHTVEYKGKGKEGVKRITAAHIVVAVGGRPRYPDNVPGAQEFGITSDDLFWLPESPGKTLLVGGGYVALECAGFLQEIGCPATVMIRGQPLRGFDQQMSEKIVGHMASTGVTFLRDSSPLKIEAVEGSSGGAKGHQVRVTWVVKGKDGRAEEKSEVFDTVVFATGRAPETGRLGLEQVGVAMDHNGKIVGGLGRLGDAAPGLSTAASLSYTQTPVPGGPTEALATLPTDDPAKTGPGGGAAKGTAAKGPAKRTAGVGGLGMRSTIHSVWSETTTVPSIHAVGDVLAGRPELTPVAIRAGKLLAQRIMRGVVPTDPDQPALAGVDPCKPPARGSTASKLVMDYALVPTTVFTPVEYGCVGLSEEEAYALHDPSFADKLAEHQKQAAAGADVEPPIPPQDSPVDVYHLSYDTLELSVAHRKDKDGLPMPPHCYAKMITVKEPSKDKDGGKDGAVQRVVGLHVLGPHAGEVIQGFAVAIRMGATREDITSTIGIHPTHAEEFTTLDRNKKDGHSAVKTSC